MGHFSISSDARAAGCVLLGGCCLDTTPPCLLGWCVFASVSDRPALLLRMCLWEPGVLMSFFRGGVRGRLIGESAGVHVGQGGMALVAAGCSDAAAVLKDAPWCALAGAVVRLLQRLQTLCAGGAGQQLRQCLYGCCPAGRSGRLCKQPRMQTVLLLDVTPRPDGLYV